MGAMGKPRRARRSIFERRFVHTSTGKQPVGWRAYNPHPQQKQGGKPVSATRLAAFLDKSDRGGEGLFAAIGGTSAKVFTDDSIPLGTGTVSYIVTPRRSGVTGTPSDIITVQFGVGGGSFAVRAVKNTGEFTIAA